MSLFKARERWTAEPSNLGQEEEYDTGCMCVANIDNAPDGAMKIATGSFQGVLRIFHPQKAEYGVEDLLYEHTLDEPILQVACGKFSSQMPQSNVLAVLHSRSLVVYSVTVTQNPVAGQPPVEVNRMYDHPQDRPASNFVVGAFGSAYGKDFVCVQSMDGLLSFFEQEVRTFSILRADFLLPGPIVYNAKTDALVTASATREIMAYQYTEMAASASAANPGDGESSLTQFKKLQVAWSVSIGETCLDIQVGRVSPNLAPGQQDIVVLGVRTLLFLKDNGAIRSQKRMDYSPLAMTLYPLPESAAVASGSHGLIISSSSNSLLVYHGMTLMWAAKTDTIPICLKVSGFHGLEGLIACLDDMGHLGLLYLGTDPPTNAVVGGPARELNYEKMDDEHRRLLDLIRDATSDQRQEPKDVVVMRVQDVEVAGAGEQTSAQVRLSVSQASLCDINDITVAISTPNGLMASQDLLVLPRLRGTPIMVMLSFEASPFSMPPSLVAQATATYTNEKGEPRVSRCDIVLPLALVAFCNSDSKEPNIKFTLHTEEDPVHLPTLYSEMAGSDSGDAAANMVGFQYKNGEDVKIIASKNAGRYRIQADSFAAMAHVTLDFTNRLCQHHAAGSSEPLKFSFQEELPVQEYFNLIDEHHSLRVQMAATRELLSDRAHQFRAIQKRLLIRFKERNPASMDNLDVLLESTYDELLELGTQHEEQQPQLRDLASRLSCGTRLFVLLLKFRFDLDEQNFNALSCHLSANCVDNFEQGWEERVNTSLLYLLRTSMAKQNKASESAITTQNPGLLEDVSKLKKHIQLVIDRLGKGLRPIKAEK